MNFKLPYFLLIILLNYGANSTFASPEDPACRLNFTTFPYLPVGGCGNINEKLQDWNGFPKSTCCQNALISFSHALALRAFEDPRKNIFIGKDEWNGCSGPFQLQPQVSAQSCGFEDFFYGSGKCSMLQLTDIDQNVMTRCSFSGSSSFDDACGDCTDAISKEVDNVVKGLYVEGNDTEKGLCLVALIISVVAGKLNDTSGVVDLDRCLPALLIPAPVKFVEVMNSVVAETILAVFLVLIGLTMIIILIKFVTKNRKPGKTPYIDISASCSSLYRFSKAEIESAINYTQERKLLGRGSKGEVYRGILPSGQVVAIKQMFRKSNTSDLFTRGIEELSRYRHPNLVSILGFCIDDGEQYLVYEYCPNGNLAQHLLRKDTDLTWELRVKIMRDCAFALKYLHDHSDGCMIHRNVKLTNILLTQDMSPKLSGFGMEKLLGIDESKVLKYAGIIGYRDYMDPDYMNHFTPTSASDIYCFGIASLQLLSGKNVIGCDLDARDQLTTKAKAVNMGKRPLIDLQDPRIRGDITIVDFERILQLVVLCVAKSTAGRPTIDLVFDELDKAWKNTQAEMRARKSKSLLDTASEPRVNSFVCDTSC